MGIEPEKINTEPSTIFPSAKTEPAILPASGQADNAAILAGAAGAKAKERKPVNSAWIAVAVIVIVCALGVYLYSYVSFKNAFEDEWSRVESNNGSYYEVKLDIEDGEIDYTFDSWLFHETIARFDYWIIMPGKVKIDGDVIDVDIDDGMMRMEPAITSIDSHEYWYK